jgi:hypothetical protein
MNKVFGIGFHKTGTHSLGSALEIVGYKVCGTKIYLVKDISAGNVAPALELAKEYDAFWDFPWPLIYKELDQKFPDSKFIITVRDEEDWLRSNRNHFGTGERESLQLIYGAGHPKGNEQIYLNRYRKHNADIFEYFKHRTSDLLVLNIVKGGGWKELCEFLDKDIPSSPFPHKQRAQYGIRKYSSREGILKLLCRIRDNATGKVKKIKDKER